MNLFDKFENRSDAFFKRHPLLSWLLELVSALLILAPYGIIFSENDCRIAEGIYSNEFENKQFFQENNGEKFKIIGIPEEIKDGTEMKIWLNEFSVSQTKSRSRIIDVKKVVKIEIEGKVVKEFSFMREWWENSLLIKWIIGIPLLIFCIIKPFLLIKEKRRSRKDYYDLPDYLK